MSQYIFGEIDVPGLDEDKSPISPFDLSRSMRLNPSNEIVQAIYGFIGQKIDQVRRELVRSDRERRQSEEAKKLASQAEEIARVINDDFYDFRERVAKAKAKGGTGFDTGVEIRGGSGSGELSYGKEEPARIVEPFGDPGSEGGTRVGGKEPRMLTPQVEADSSEKNKLGEPVGEKDGRRAVRGGFRVEFKPLGVDDFRARYENEERTIYINLEHPQLKAAKGVNSIDDPTFLRLAYEVAFSEYAIALAHELVSIRKPHVLYSLT